MSFLGRSPPASSCLAPSRIVCAGRSSRVGRFVDATPFHLGLEYRGSFPSRLAPTAACFEMFPWSAQRRASLAQCCGSAKVRCAKSSVTGKSLSFSS